MSSVKINRRKEKKETRKLVDALMSKGYFEDCNYMPCRVTVVRAPFNFNSRQNVLACDVDGDNLISGHGTSCSLYSCNPLPLTENEANERVNFYNQHGRLEYLKKFVYGPLTAEQEAELINFYNSWNNFGGDSLT